MLKTKATSINKVNIHILTKGEKKKKKSGQVINLRYIHWWGYAQAGCRQQCGPAGAAGRNSGASVQPRGHRCCFQGPCSSLQVQHRHELEHKSEMPKNQWRMRKARTFQQRWRPELNRHVGDFAGQLHGRYNHVVTLLRRGIKKKI